MRAPCIPGTILPVTILPEIHDYLSTTARDDLHNGEERDDDDGEEQDGDDVRGVRSDRGHRRGDRLRRSRRLTRPETRPMLIAFVLYYVRAKTRSVKS